MATEQRSKLLILIAVMAIVLIADQVVKFWVKTNMSLGEEFLMMGLPWARIHFVENPGMAFGWSFDFAYGKLILSLFRIVAVILMGFYLYWLLKDKSPMVLIMGFGLIMAGAIGNIIDSAIYGLIFSESYFHDMPAQFMPEGGGYAPFLHGKVVDMLYFPLAEGFFPDWLPFWGGESYLFFRPVFNIADVAISSGVILIIVLHLFFSSLIHPQTTALPPTTPTTDTEQEPVE